jgi:hypothetical protein
MMKALALGLVVLAAVPPAASATKDTLLHVLPGTTAFPENIGADPRTGAYFTGSLIDGTIYRGTLSAPEAQVLSPAGADGRTNVAGVKIDNKSRIWIADAFNGRVLVYDEEGQLLHSFVLNGPGSPTVNDIVFGHGYAYVTDSARPFLYRFPVDAADRPGTTPVLPWLDVSGVVSYSTGEGPLGVNLNGIVASTDGSTLLVVQTNTGMLFRVDVATHEIERVAVRGADLLFGDGLLRIGDHLYVARNAVNEIVKLRLGQHWRTAAAIASRHDTSFAFPTALAVLRGRLLITNSQLDKGPSPSLPFTIVDMPIAGF